MSDYDKSIHSNPDAQAWAKFFIDTIAEQSWRIEDIDEGLMTGWFANAMMAMHDHVKREHEFECPRCGHCCPEREWVGLSRDEVLDIEESTTHPLEFARAIEAKLKEKNT
jgi:hypothetical protein